jgi:hypothetical protein
MTGGKMTPRESIEVVLMGGVADHIPFTIYENKIPQCAAERQLRNQGVCIIQRISPPVYRTIMPNVNVTALSYTEDGKQLVKTQYETPVGALYTIAEPAGFTTWMHKRLFSRPDDYKPLLYLINDMQFESNYDEFAYALKVDGGDSFFRGSLGLEPMQALIFEYMSAETFCTEWFDRRDEILKLYNALVEKRRQVYHLCADSPCLAFNYGGNVTPEILGLERFETYYVPHYNEAADVLHKKGKLIGVHFDANCKLIAAAIAQTKLDYIEAFTPAPDTDMTLAEARHAWPDKTLWINFPSSVHLESIETIKQTTRDLLVQMGSPKRFIMGITEDIPEDRWRQNLLAISETLLEYKIA